MAYEGPEYWYVIYKAIADFGDLMRDARRARDELNKMADAAKTEAQTEVTGATKAAEARKQDVSAMREETTALNQLATAAKATNVQLLYGGRSDAQQHLADLQRELQMTELLNRAHWLGFSSVQQAVSYRYQMLQLALQENKARFGGYLTPDQWLGYLQKEITAYNTEAAAIRSREVAIRDETSAMLALQNAAHGTHESIGQLGEGASGAAAYGAALGALPDLVITKVEFDDTGAGQGLRDWVGMLAAAVRDRYAFYAQFDDTAAMSELNRFVEEVKAGAMSAEQAFRLLDLSRPAGMGGAAGGGGGGSPPRTPPGAAALPPGEGDGEAAAAAAAAEELRRLQEQLDATAAAERDAGRQAAYTAQDFLNMAAGASSGAKAYAYVRAAALLNAMAQQQAAKSARDAGGAVGAMVSPLVLAGGGWFGLTARLALFGGLMPGVLGHIAGWHILLDAIVEVLAILIPSIVTLIAGLAAFGAVGSASAQQVYQRLQAVRTASTATGQAIAPLTGQLQAMQDAARPQVWQLYGDVLTVVNNKTGLFGKLAQETGTVVDRLAARFTVFATSANKGLTTFFTVGGQDLAQLGRVLLNLGSALFNLIKVTQDTHIDQIFLQFLVAVSGLIGLIAKLPVPLLAVAVGLHALWLWGGLATTIVLQLLSPLRALALALGGVAAAESAGGLASLGKDASAWARLKAGLTDIVNGFAALPARVGLASKASREAGAAAGSAAAAIDEEAAAMSGAAAGSGELAAASSTLLGIPIVGWILAAVAALGIYAFKVFTANDNTQKWILSLDKTLAATSSYKLIGQTVADLAAVTGALAAAQRGGAGNATELSAAQADLSAKLGTELDHVGQVAHAYGTSLPGALNLLQVAGVKTSDLFTAQGKVWAADLQQVRGLVAGYAAMGQGLTQLQGDVSVQLVMNADQLAQMQKLNTAWDQWITLVTSGESAFVTMQQDLATANANAAVTGAAMGGLNAQSLTLRASFLALLPQAGQVLDAIRSQSAVLQNGAAGTKILTNATKDLAAELIPLAGNNQAARASVLALVQEANPAITTWQALTKWVGNEGAAGAASNLDTIMTRLETPVSNLAADAAKLTTALQSELNPAMANAEFTALGGQQAFNAFATDLLKFGPGSRQTITAGRSVAEILLSINKNSSAARDQFVSWAESMGLSSKQATALWTEVSKGVKPMADVRDGLASSATASDKLDKSGFFAGIKDHYANALQNLVRWFGDTLPHAMANVGGFFARMWSGGYQVFQRDVGGPIATFFTVTLLGFFTSTIPKVWDKAWSGLVTPVMRAFDAVKRAIVSGFDSWWKTHGSAVEAIWNATWGNLERLAVADARIIASGVAQLWHDIEGLFRGGTGTVTGLFTGLWHVLEGLGRAFWQVFGPILKIGWDIAAGIFKIAIGTITAVVKVFWDGLVTLARVFWAGLQAIIKIAWDTIVAIFSVALDLLTGHWHQAWADIKNYGEQVWNALKGFFHSAWSAFRADFEQVLGQVKTAWTTTWGAIKTAADQIWGALKTGFSNVVSSIKTTWTTLEGIFKAPVSFLVNDVYDSGIARLWNDVMGAIGGPKLPIIKFAAGGRLPGFGGGDTVPAWIRGGGPALLEPGEAVVDKDTTRRYSWLLKLMGVPGFQGGGVIGDITGFFTGAAHDIAHLLGDAFDIGKIVVALLSGNTTALLNALLKLIGTGGATGELAEMITGIPKTLIADLVDAAKTAVTKVFSVGGPGGSATAGVQTVARFVMGHGGTREAGAGVGGVVAGESGGNPEAIQAGGGGGTGLIQWTPASSAGPIQPLITGNVGRDMAVQLVDMMAYIAGRGGIGAINAGGAAGGPMGAAEVFSRMEAPAVPGSDIRPSVVAQLYAQGLASGGLVRMASGGAVINAIKAVSGNREIREAMALASYLATGWNASYDKSGLFGPFGQPATRGATRADWQNPTWAARHLLGSFAQGVSNAGTEWARYPRAAAAHAARYAERFPPGTSFAAGPLDAAWNAALIALGYASGTPGPKSTPGGLDTAQAWAYYSGLLSGAYNSEANAFWALNAAKLPTGKGKATPDQWAGWYADLLVMQAQQGKVGSAWGALSGNLSHPLSMSAAQWSTYISALTTMGAWEHGVTPPKSAWAAEKGHPWPKGYKPGSVKPVNWAGWKYENALWSRANTATSHALTDVQKAYGAWLAQFSPGAPGGPPISEFTTPGVLVTVPGQPPHPVDLSSLIVGGPAAATFSRGGLAGVASMFAMGGMVPPAEFRALGLPPAIQRQLAGASAMGLPRSLSDAAGDRIGVKIGNLTVHNPVREKPSDTIARSTNRLAFLAGRGAV